jgi:hypothetical protein
MFYPLSYINFSHEKTGEFSLLDGTADRSFRLINSLGDVVISKK